MKRRDDDIVTASEIAQWAWCPEAWRLESLGHEPGNEKTLRWGKRHHALKAVFERCSKAAIRLGVWLLVVGLLLAALVLAFVLVRG